MTGIPLDAIRDREAGTPAAAATTSTLAHPQPWLTQWATGNIANEPGPVVNEVTALSYAALYTCVSLIAGTIAALPCKLYRRRPDGGQDEVDDHPIHDRLQVEFNPNTSAMIGRETEVGHLLTWGNGYAQIVKNGRGEVVRLQNLGPDICHADTNSRGELVYTVRDRETGTEQELPRGEVLHTPYFSFDGMVGMSPIRIAKTTIRSGMAQDRAAERFVSRGIRPPGAMKFPAGKKFKTEAEGLQFRNRFRAIHQTEDGDQQILILEDGAEWETLGTDPVSAQLLESRKFTRGEIAGFYHIPPHLIGDVEKNTSWGTGIEELNIGFVVYCLLPILRRLEQERNRKLFDRRRDADRGLFVEHVLAGLLRGDTLKQAQAIEIYLRNGLLSVNESRRILGWNPTVGGDVRYFPLSFGRTDADGNDIPPPEQPGKTDAGSGVKPAAAIAMNTTTPAATATALPGPPTADLPRLAVSLRKAFGAAVGRCLRKEAEQARRAANRPGQFLAWIDEFYDRHADMVREHTGPTLDAWAAAFGGDAGDYPARHVERSRAELLDAAGSARGEELPAAVNRVTERWLSDRLTDAAAELQPGVLAHA